MRRRLLRVAVLGSLVGLAAVCSVFSYQALRPEPQGPDDWGRAIELARRSEQTKAVLPALRMREQAAAIFDRLATTGSRQARSQAKLLGALIQVRGANDQADRGQSLALAVADLQGAVRLDRSNDDAAYDLELLLARSVQTGQPIGTPRPEKTRTPPTAGPGASPSGTGY